MSKSKRGRREGGGGLLSKLLQPKEGKNVIYQQDLGILNPRIEDP